MHKLSVLFKNHIYEFLFQILLLALVFVFYATERHNGETFFRLDEPKFWFFINYTFAAYIINYYLLSKYLYRKKYAAFAIGVCLILALVIYMEEGVIEQIYFPTTRGARFPGVFFNLMSALPTITILAGFKFAWDALTKQREVEHLKIAMKESELQFLKTQINPHFLFNNLNNLYAYALEQSPKTPEIILELSGLLRYMLYECSETFVRLDREVEQLQNFVNLSQLQLESRGEVQMQIDVVSNAYKIAPLILSVFIENSFKHSMSSQNDNIKIDIKLNVDENGSLLFQCNNSYTVQSNTDDLSNGIGLENVKKRLSILYPDNHKLHINATDNEYQVSLRLGLKSADL
jgi:hypothetical protein